MEHQLSNEELAHVNTLIAHYNDLHPDQKKRLITHAKNNDHASMKDWVKGAAEFLGISIGAPGIVGIAAFFVKKFREMHRG